MKYVLGFVVGFLVISSATSGRRIAAVNRKMDHLNSAPAKKHN